MDVPKINIFGIRFLNKNKLRNVLTFHPKNTSNFGNKINALLQGPQASLKLDCHVELLKSFCRFRRDITGGNNFSWFFYSVVSVLPLFLMRVLQSEENCKVFSWQTEWLLNMKVFPLPKKTFPPKQYLEIKKVVLDQPVYLFAVQWLDCCVTFLSSFH